MGFSNFLLPAVFVLLLGAFALADFVDVAAPGKISPCSLVYTPGYIYNSSNVSQTLGSVNFTTYIGNATNATIATNSTLTNSAGLVNVSFVAPCSTGNYNITIGTNTTTKIIPVYVSNVATAVISYTGRKPPFTVGDNFTVNVTLRYGNGTAVSSYAPEVKVFSADGGEVSGWGVSNLSATTDATGTIVYNISIPSSADGQYAIVAERGAGVSVFSVKYGYTIAVSAYDAASGTDMTSKFRFATTGSVGVLAKVRDSSGAPVTGAAVNLYITLPNNTGVNYTLAAHPNTTSYAGYYNTTIAWSNAPAGAYEARVVATTSGRNIETFGGFELNDIAVSIQPDKVMGFFDDFGEQAFPVGGNVSMAVLVMNMSSEELISMSGSACNKTNVRLVDVRYAVNGTSVNSSINNSIVYSGTYFNTPVCYVAFTGTPGSAVYGMKVNVTVAAAGSNNYTGEGYFTAQRYSLKVGAVSSIGGSYKSAFLSSPGDNVTFKIRAGNITSKAALPGTAISSWTALKIVPLSFEFGGASEINVTTIDNTARTGAGDPVITITLPNQTGPMLFYVQANVSGEIIQGSGFIVSKRIMGFLMPAGGYGGGVGGGGGMGGPAMSFGKCSGSVNYTVDVRDVKTQQGVQGVNINNVIEMREEMSGRNLRNCISITPGSTGSGGSANITLTFNSSCSLSGFNFISVNATYNGQQDQIEGGMMCKNLNFWPMTDNWQKSPTSAVNVTVSGIQYMNGSSVTAGNVSIARIFNYDMIKGGRMYAASVPLNRTFAAGNATLTIAPQNFTGLPGSSTKWPNGFVDMEVRVCDSAGTCDTSHSGFRVVSFDAYIDNMWGFYGGGDNAKSPGQNMSLIIAARTNVTNNFSASIGKPWEGSMVDVAAINGVKQSDNWNGPNDQWGYERWNVTLTIPNDAAKGMQMLRITVNNTAGESTDVEFYGLQVAKYSVVVAPEVGLPMDNALWLQQQIPQQNTTLYQLGFNITEMNNTLGWSIPYQRIIGVKGNSTTPFTMNSYGMNGGTITYSPPAAISILASTSSNVADRVAFQFGNATTLNMSNSTATMKVLLVPSGGVANTAVRKLNATLAGVPITTFGSNTARSLYLWSIEGDGYAKFADPAVQQSWGRWGGTWQTNQWFAIPFKVTMGGTPQAGINVTVASVAVQDMMGSGSSGRGFGFKGDVSTNQWAAAEATTDENGIAFVPVRINRTGRLLLFWQIKNSTGGELDRAQFGSSEMGGGGDEMSGIEVEIRAFSTYANYIYDTPQNVVTLSYTPNTPGNNTGWSVVPPADAPSNIPYYYGNITETSLNSFIQDNVPATYYIAYIPSSNSSYPNHNNATFIQRGSTNFVGAASGLLNSTNNWRIGGGFLSNIQLGVSKYSVINGTSAVFAFYQDQPSQNWFMANSTSNVSIAVCAQDFQKPNANPVTGSRLNITMEVFQPMGPSTTTALTVYDPITHLNSTNVTTGPNGCVGVTISPPSGGWSCWNNIQGTLTNGAWINGTAISGTENLGMPGFSSTCSGGYGGGW